MAVTQDQKKKKQGAAGDGETTARSGALGKGLLVIVLAIVAAVVIGMLITGRRDEAGTNERRATFATKRGDLVVRVSESGTLRTSNPIKIMAEITGQATIVELVEEGTRVKEGDLLVRLDASDLAERKAQQQIELENAQARLVESAEDKRIQEINNESEIASSKLAVENARMEREKYGEVAINADGFLDENAYESGDAVEEGEAETVPDEEAEGEADVKEPEAEAEAVADEEAETGDAVEEGEAETVSDEEAETGAAPPKGEAYQAFRDAELEIIRSRTQLDEAKRDFDGMDKLLEKGFVTRNDYITKDLNVLEKTRNLESAELKHHLLKTYTYPKQRAQLDANMAKAAADLKQTELTTVSRLRQKDAAIEQAQRLHDMRKEQLEETVDQLSKMAIIAPEDGLVIYGDERRWWERDRIKVGGTVSRGTVILTLPRVSKMLAAVEVAEKDIGKIKLDQRTLITMAALPELTISGKVAKIANVASEANRWSGSSVKTFEIEVAMDTTDDKMKPGMSCEVAVTIDTLEDILYVPVNAVYKHGERDVCFHAASGVVETLQVTLGQSGEIYVEVVEGLDEGDEVLLYEAMPALLTADGEALEQAPADEEAADSETEAEVEAKEDEATTAADEKAVDADAAAEDAAEAVSEEKAEADDAVAEGEAETVSDEEAETEADVEEAEAVAGEEDDTADEADGGAAESASDAAPDVQETDAQPESAGEVEAEAAPAEETGTSASAASDDETD